MEHVFDRPSFERWRLATYRTVWTLVVAVTLGFQTTMAASFGMPKCPGKWIGGNCVCANGQQAHAYECSGNFCFRCPEPRPQRDDRAQCGGGAYCPEGTQCMRNGKGCIRKGSVDCGHYYCGAGNKCGNGWDWCVASDADDCGAAAKMSCGANTKCFTAKTDAFKEYEVGKTYCLTENQLTKVQDKGVADRLRDELKAKRAERKRKKEEASTKQADASEKQQSQSATNTSPRAVSEALSLDLKAAEQDVKAAQRKLSNATADHSRDVKRAEERYSDSLASMKQLTEELDTAHKAGDNTKRVQLIDKIAQEAKKSERYHREIKELKAQGTDPRKLDRIEKDLTKARERVAEVQKAVPTPPTVPPKNDAALSSDKSLSTSARPTAPAAGDIQKPNNDNSRADVAATPTQPGQATNTNVNTSASAPNKNQQPAPPTKTATLPLTTTNTDAAPRLQLKKWFVDETTNPYGGANQHFRSVADNAQYAQLANAAYGGQIPAGWTEESAASSLSSMDAKIYKSPTGEMVVAFAGTASRRDLMNDALLAGVPISKIPQFSDALYFSRALLADGKKVTFVGHSLGGGVAHYVAAELKQPAVAFNPAPINASLITDKRFDLLSYDKITNFRGPDDPLTGLTGKAIIGPSPIEVNNMPTINAGDGIKGAWIKNSFIKENHGMADLARAMSAAELVQKYLDQPENK